MTVQGHRRNKSLTTPVMADRAGVENTSVNTKPWVYIVNADCKSKLKITFKINLHKYTIR